ncbi:decaprenyl-diphosphate synthase subunit 1 [Meleagris gallopavo]|uniref:Uncharacterized protein n=1 Tax=Meleagris gallopavo TaxID=9103 RepID=G1N4U2_MELGA|nr:decaprenyl-diphosphate synthase subunit 1 [Meleagris gallopavo]
MWRFTESSRPFLCERCGLVLSVTWGTFENCTSVSARASTARFADCSCKGRKFTAPEQKSICHFPQRSSVWSFPKLCSISWRLYHTSTAHMCSCSKTVSDEKYQDPFQLGRKDLKNLYEDIKKELLVSTAELREMCEYYFDGKGKAFRPMIVVLMARACNIHHSNSREVQASQRSVAIIAEMIHTASLVHDDVIDDANSRRGKMTVNQIWGERKAVLAGDFILSAASLALARIGNTTIISVLTQVIEDLVRGEFLQLGSKENENERFAHYLEKTFKKTASLIANSCKAVCTSVSSKVNILYCKLHSSIPDYFCFLWRPSKVKPLDDVLPE